MFNQPTVMKQAFFFTILLAVVFIGSCNNKANDPAKKPEIVDNNQVEPAENDTFQFYDMRDEPIYWQADIPKDSLIFKDKQSAVYRLFPVLSKIQQPAAYKWIREQVGYTKEEFRELTKDTPQDGYADDAIVPMIVYRDNRLLSLAMLQTSSATGTYHEFEHATFLYDFVKKKEIDARDYFILDTPADTLFLNRFLNKCSGHTDLDFRVYGNLETIFSLAIDTANVYFFFGRHHVLGLIDKYTCVPKKYIRDRIRPEYR